MKKTLIALAVAGAAVATGANASELYNQDGTTLAIGGRAEARMSVMDSDVSDVSRVRVNFLGKQEITEDLYGLGFYEAEYMTNDEADSDTDTIDTRYIYAGLGGSFGQVTYGKQDGALVAITNFTDIMDYHGATAAQELATASDHIDNMLAYTGTFGDFSVNASYRFADRLDQGDDPADPTSYSDNDFKGYAASGIYNLADTGVALGLGVADQHSTINPDNATDDDDSTVLGATQYIATASYTMDNLYLSALYTFKNYDHSSVDYDGYELAAQYTLGKTVLIATYDNGDDDEGNSKVNDLGLEAAYKFKPNFKAYIDYNVNMLSGDQYDESAHGTEDEAVLGLLYNF